MKITICGGGHLGHVVAGFLAAQETNEVRVLTRKPAVWSNELEITDLHGKVFNGKLAVVTDDAEKAMRDVEMVILCLPGFSIREELEKIKPYLPISTKVGAVVGSTGFFFAAFDILPKEQPLFAFQRVPFISRTTEYGHKATLHGYRPELFIAVENYDAKEHLRLTLEDLFKTPVVLLDSHYEVSLTNSNPILHTCRLYTMWKDYKEGVVFNKNPLFYREWTDEASYLLVAMDAEFQQLMKTLPVREGAIPTLLDYYESKDAPSITRKLHSIPAFDGIYSPMKAVEGGWIPDFNSRYFTEDFPYGLTFIHDLCHERGILCPNIDKVYEWGIKNVEKNERSSNKRRKSYSTSLAEGDR